MTSNGSESLHNVFREARQRPICALVIATYYKLLEWFNGIKILARDLANMNQIFSNRVSHILERRAEKAQRFEVRVADIEAGTYEVHVKGERQTRRGPINRIYDVEINQGAPPKCKCRKPQNTRIACSHVLAVCAFRNYEANEFTNEAYTVARLAATWDGRFKIFGGEEDWPPYAGERVIPDRSLVKRGRRKTKRYNMTMDILEGRLGTYCETCGTITHTTAQHPQAAQQPQASQQAGTSQSGASTSRTRGIFDRLRRHRN